MTRTLPQAPAPESATARHHASHAGLVTYVDAPDSDERIDAIVVPTARSVPYLRDALLLGRRLDAPVVALCSKWADPEKSRAEAHGVGAHVIAAEVPSIAELPTFETSVLLAAHKSFHRPADTSMKRNIGLALARMVGWKRIVFIDDDITDIRAADIRGAASLLRQYDLVGLANEGFPDNSVVCHARRAVGLFQDSFVGGGAMAVTVDADTSFFPNIYNEDWFFLVDGARLRKVAVTGKVSQKTFDPYDSDLRARHQEFGDCLAEGLFALLDAGQPERARDPEYWTAFLRDRGELITRIIGEIPRLDLPSDEKARMSASMLAAQGRRRLITADLCVAFITAWQADREKWRSYLGDLPEVNSPRKALARLGLTSTHIAVPR